MTAEKVEKNRPIQPHGLMQWGMYHLAELQRVPASNHLNPRDVLRTLQGVTTQPIDAYLTSLSVIHKERVKPTPAGIHPNRAEGVLFQVFPELAHPDLVKIYHNTRLHPTITLPILRQLYGEKPGQRTTMMTFLPMGQAETTATRIHGVLAAKNGPSLASAEILVRTMAHMVIPDLMPLPTALLDTSGQPVGFTLPLEQRITGSTYALSYKRAEPDLLLEMDMGGIYEPALGISSVTTDLLHNLATANIYVWPNPGHLSEQLLLGPNHEPMTFDRLGYQSTTTPHS